MYTTFTYFTWTPFFIHLCFPDSIDNSLLKPHLNYVLSRFYLPKIQIQSTKKANMLIICSHDTIPQHARKIYDLSIANDSDQNGMIHGETYIQWKINEKMSLHQIWSNCCVSDVRLESICMATSWPSSSKDPRLWQRALVQRELSDLRSRWGAMWGEAPVGDEHWTPSWKGRFDWNWISSCSFIFWFCRNFLGCKVYHSILQEYLFWSVFGDFYPFV